ncbi:AmmeMemoRadiSam system protein B [Acidobacteriota bacterium]
MDNPRVRPLEAFPIQIEGELLIALRDPTQLVEQTLIIPEDLFFVVQRLNGRNTVLDIQADYMRAKGDMLYRERIEEIIRGLDENFLLNNERFQAYQQKLIDDFRQSEIRQAAHAGKSYDQDREKLKATFDSFLTGNEFQTGLGQNQPPLKGLVAPHIDLQAGRDCFARAYNAVAAEEEADVYIIFGTCHAGSELFSLTRKHYETPFGIVKTCQECVDGITSSLSYDPFKDEFFHKGEHSIEFQVLWLQFVLKKPFKIVPILCGGYSLSPEALHSPMEHPEVSEMVGAVGKVLDQVDHKVVMIAGADLAHLGPRYGDSRAVGEADMNSIEREDARLQECIDKVDAEGFYQIVMADGNRRRICGLSSIYTLLSVLKKGEGRRLAYDIWQDTSSGSAVSFVSAEIR